MTEPVRTIVSNRLSQVAYAALEKACLGTLPKVPATGELAMFATGVEFVLRKLRDGFVIEKAE